MISHFIYSCWILGYLVQKSCLILGFLNLNLLQKSCLIWMFNLQIWLISAKSRHWTRSILLEKLEPIAKPAEWSGLQVVMTSNLYQYALDWSCFLVVLNLSYQSTLLLSIWTIYNGAAGAELITIGKRVKPKPWNRTNIPWGLSNPY